MFVPTKERGPVLSAVRDTKTGQTFYGLNHPTLDPPKNLHPLLQERLEKLTAEYGEGALRTTASRSGNKGVHPSPPGSHSEVFALNEALLARQKVGMAITEADLQDFAVYNLWLPPKAPRPYLPLSFAPRCGNCRTLTDGAYMLGNDVRAPAKGGAQ